jgi:hypothetical protein
MAPMLQDHSNHVTFVNVVLDAEQRVEVRDRAEEQHRAQIDVSICRSLVSLVVQCEQRKPSDELVVIQSVQETLQDVECAHLPAYIVTISDAVPLYMIVKEGGREDQCRNIADDEGFDNLMCILARPSSTRRSNVQLIQ